MVVNAGIMEGVYVLIDRYDHHAEWRCGSEAKQLLTEMASKYDKYPHVLFETDRESLAASWTGVIKPYHQQVVPVVR